MFNLIVREDRRRERRMKSNTPVKMALSIIFLVLLIGSMVSTSFQASGGGLKLPDKEWVDGTYMRDWQIEKMNARPSASMSGGGGSDPPTDMEILVSDFYRDIDYPQNFRLIMTGDYCYIYVAYDLAPDPEYGKILNYYDPATDQYVFENPRYPTGGWTPKDKISKTQLTYIMNEFDDTIYPTDTGIFGTPIPRPTPDEDNIFILILNIRDPSFYDESYTWYVAGYFSWGETAMYDLNMIHIDTYDWRNRIGPGVARPYLYEGVVAHEFEHLIHNDMDPGEESWVDEGLADLAGFFCGYGHSAGHIANYLAYHPWTSLTFWGGALEHYGICYLFQLYLWEHFGGTPFTMDLVQNPLHGIDGIVDTLHDRGYIVTFGEVFNNFAIANYIDDLSIGAGEYGYFSLDIPSLDTWGYSIQYVLWNWWIGMEFNRGFGWQASWWPGAPQPYTAHYWEFSFIPAGYEANFQYGGDEFSGVPAHSGDYHWYGGMGNWVWRRLSQVFPVPGGDATLKFWTFYEIETDWDYAYVEVHDLDTGEWTTLPGVATTTTLPHVQDNPSTPSGREPMDYFAAGKWNALTGFSGGYYQEIMDLSPFAGDDIELYFVYWTDGAYNEQGIYIDDIEIPEIPFFDDVEAGEDGWTNAGWMRTKQTDWPNFWEGKVIDITGIQPYRNPSCRYNMRTGKMINFQPGMLHYVWPLEGTATEKSLTIPREYVNEGHVFVAIFYNTAPHILRGDYWFYVY